MIKFTLDTNCVLAVIKREVLREVILTLADAHANGQADVQIVAIMESENQQGGVPLADFREFEKRLAESELAHLPLCLPVLTWDFTFWGGSVWAKPTDQQLELDLQAILHPDLGGGDAKKFRNRKADIHAMLSHLHHERDVFVSSDDVFHSVENKPRLLSLGAGRIEKPDAAAGLLRGAL